MGRLPSYIGPAAFGLKMGVIVPGCDLLQLVSDIIIQCDKDGLLEEGDVLCITESVVARAQDNYVSIEQVAEEIRQRLQVDKDGKIGVLYPIASRNRFAMILEAIAAAVPQGEVVVQLSWPRDEVGNQVIGEECASRLGKVYTDSITQQELEGQSFEHPITKVDYIDLYKKIIEGQGARAVINLSNDTNHLLSQDIDAVIVSDIHRRENTLAAVADKVKAVSLVDFCSDPKLPVWSEWGLLGSNMSSGDRIKLAPRNASAFAQDVQREVADITGKEIEVIVYGDGAYKDPTTQIYELADPQPVFGATLGFANVMREGFKYKYLADVYHQQGKSAQEIETMLADQSISSCQPHESEGTTPRRMEDVIASVADLVSGSADAGTPLVLVKGFLV